MTFDMMMIIAIAHLTFLSTVVLLGTLQEWSDEFQVGRLLTGTSFILMAAALAGFTYACWPRMAVWQVKLTLSAYAIGDIGIVLLAIEDAKVGPIRRRWREGRDAAS